MSKELTLVDMIYELLAVKHTWSVRPIEERRAVIAAFHKRVDELSVGTPCDTDDGMVHHFGAGTYGREANVPAGVALVGMTYKEPQINVLLKGKVFVVTENIVDVICAPSVFTSDANTNKVGYVIEDMQWITVMGREEEVTNPTAILKQHTTGG